jgi:hypothetical protein
MSDKQVNLDEWNNLVLAENQSISAMLSDWSKIEDKVATLRAALNTPHHRGTALRLLILLQDDNLTKELFTTLVDQASVAHSDISLCRMAIKSLPRQWLLGNIDSAVSLLANLGEEEYLRIAELYEEIDKKLLRDFCDLISKSQNPEIQRIVNYFSI